jgi:hypothetical protein
MNHSATQRDPQRFDANRSAHVHGKEAHQLVVGVCEGESLVGVNDLGERAVSKDLLEGDRVASALQVVGCKRVSR